MPRYTKQRDNYSCAPVAILNALRWAGVDAPYEWVTGRIRRRCKTGTGGLTGTCYRNFDKALRHFGKRHFVVRRKREPGLDQVKLLLDQGKGVAFRYVYVATDKEGNPTLTEEGKPIWKGHMVFAFSTPDGNLRIVNDHHAGQAERSLAYSPLSTAWQRKNAKPECKRDVILQVWELTPKHTER